MQSPAECGTIRALRSRSFPREAAFPVLSVTGSSPGDGRDLSNPLHSQGGAFIVPFQLHPRRLHYSFFRDLSIGEVPARSRLLLMGMWCLADRHGRLENNPHGIWRAVFPYERARSIEHWMHPLVKAGLISRTKEVIQIESWAYWQGHAEREARRVWASLLRWGAA